MPETDPVAEFGHIARLPFTAPASLEGYLRCAATDAVLPGSNWKRPCSLPRTTWLHEIYSDTISRYRMVCC